MSPRSLQCLVASLFRPLDIASLVYARVVFGLVMLWEVWRYFDHNRIYRYWIEPDFHFTYPGFHWIAPLPGDGMYWLFVGLGLLAVFITLGLLYRLSAILFFLGFTYMFLLEQGQYLNHFYFVCLLSFLLIFIPAHRSSSLDIRLGITKPSDTAPAWTLWILRFQISIVYFYGGLAKINGDWLAGEPLRDWLEGRSHFPLIGEYLVLEPVVLILAWGGMLFDLLIPFLLLWKPTRLAGFLLTAGFHLTNAVLWSIGIFPWMTLALSALFFPADWPRRFFRLPRYRTKDRSLKGWPRRLALSGVAIYCLCQILIPFRHWAYPGDVKWTEEGHRFSWRMKLRSRDGDTELFVRDKKTGITHEVDPHDYLLPWQVDEMSTRPDMLLLFARHLKQDWEARHDAEFSVHAHSFVSVNGRPEQVYFPSTIDLAEISRFDRRSEWMYPFHDTPLPSARKAIVLD